MILIIPLGPALVTGWMADILRTCLYGQIAAHAIPKPTGTYENVINNFIYFPSTEYYLRYPIYTFICILIWAIYAYLALEYNQFRKDRLIGSLIISALVSFTLLLPPIILFVMTIDACGGHLKLTRGEGTIEAWGLRDFALFSGIAFFLYNFIRKFLALKRKSAG